MTRDLRRHDDAELVALAREGDAAAFEAIYDRHCSGVARVLASFAGTDRDLLDDLTQDVFLKVVGALRSYAPIRPFTHWLFTIALNVGRNHARNRSRVIPVNPAELETVAGAVERENSPDGQEPSETLAEMVSALPGPMRDVVSLRVGCEMSYSEIADVLGIPEGTARSRMHNAVKALRAKADIGSENRRIENE